MKTREFKTEFGASKMAAPAFLKETFYITQGISALKVVSVYSVRAERRILSALVRATGGAVP